MKITVIICTYNRAQILDEVLSDLLSRVNLSKVDEILVINNNSSDDTESVIEKHSLAHPILKGIKETKQGLSYARNRGIKESKGNFLFFLDDDALCEADLFEKMAGILELRTEIRVLGGIYVPWYRFGKPDWFKDEYASSSFTKSGLHILPDDEYLSGSNMLFEKKIFDRYGAFDVNLGMKENTIHYGEETELQERLRENGVSIYGDDDLFVRHIVQSYKLDYKWFFIQKKALGKSLSQRKGSTGLLQALKGFALALGMAIVYGILNFGKLLSKNYYWENYMIDSFGKPYKWYSYGISQLKS